jgi:arylsulfatase A-like enzyme
MADAESEAESSANGVREMQPLASRERLREICSWLPLGLWLAGALALLRQAAVAEIARSTRTLGGPADDGIQAWVLARDFPPVLLGGLVVGLLAALLARTSALHPRSVRGGTAAAGAFVFVATLAFLSGWAADPASTRASFGTGRYFSNLALQAVLALLLTAFLFHFARVHAARATPSRLLQGVPASVVALLVAVGLPLVGVWAPQRNAPRFTQHVNAHDFLAHRESWKVLEAPEDRAPELGILTPAASQETDSGDKPALLLAPPSSVELVVPQDAGPCVLRAAAGADKTVRGQMPEGLDALEVEFEVWLDGTSVFRERIRSERLRDGVYTPEDWVWRHVGGERGLAVRPGQTIRLATRIVDLPAGVALPSGYPRVGFGGLWLEREIERPRAEATPEEPNIVLVVMDTQRADRLSCYGYNRETTPNLDALAARGTLYEHAYSTASWTWPSTASILTGLEPAVHGVLSQEQCTLQLLFDTLAEVLQARDYTTHGVSCNPLIAPERYFDQGFESFDPPKNEFRKSPEVVPSVERWVEAHAGVRFFLYLHLVDPHTPHAPDAAELARLGLTAPADFPERGMDHYNSILQRGQGPAELETLVPPAHRQWISDEYDACVATGDHWVGELLRELEELGLDDRTVIAFTADHGEELFDHGMLEHGHTLHEELVHVPLILAGPGVQAGARVDRVVSLRHLAPTLARLAGTRMPQVGDAEDLLSEEGSEVAQFQTYKGVWIESDPDGGSHFVKGQHLSGLRAGDLVLHWRELPERSAPSALDLRLYDASLDPDELHDVGDARVSERDGLLARLRQLLKQQRDAAPAFPVGTSDGTLEMLRAYGYAGDEDGEDEGH